MAVGVSSSTLFKTTTLQFLWSHYQPTTVGAGISESCAGVLERWDRRADGHSIGTLLFLKWATAVGANGEGIGGFAVPLDDLRPLQTPRGFNNPERAVQALNEVIDKRLHSRCRDPCLRPSVSRKLSVYIS